MKKDRNKTDVVFYLDKENNKEVWAWFPDTSKPISTPSGYVDYISECYSHVGQHSKCNQAYRLKCIKAKPEQYADLKAELESIGYNLNVLNTATATQK